ncbi:MAG: hypothetical protein ACYC6A_01580 [Armatimonadota bacterium]
MTSNKSTSVVPQDYATVLGEIKERIRIAQYDALRESNKPIGVATYRTVKTLPAELRRELPAPEQVAMLLEGMG